MKFYHSYNNRVMNSGEQAVVGVATVPSSGSPNGKSGCNKKKLGGSKSGSSSPVSDEKKRPLQSSPAGPLQQVGLGRNPGLRVRNAVLVAGSQVGGNGRRALRRTVSAGGYTSYLGGNGGSASPSPPGHGHRTTPMSPTVATAAHLHTRTSPHQIQFAFDTPINHFPSAAYATESNFQYQRRLSQQHHHNHCHHSALVVPNCGEEPQLSVDGSGSHYPSPEQDNTPQSHPTAATDKVSEEVECVEEGGSGGVEAEAGESGDVSALFLTAFLQNNRVDHVCQTLAYHPHYLDHFLKTQQCALRGDGPLPHAHRHYIAIMASARHHCSYLLNTQKAEFLLAGGDAGWLRGVEYAPQKLRDLAEVNNILAHRPWLMKREHIERLTRGTGTSAVAADTWSVSELAHAIVLLVYFHSLCSLVYGCGINPEVDHPDGHTFTDPTTTTTTSVSPVITSNGVGGAGDQDHDHESESHVPPPVPPPSEVAKAVPVPVVPGVPGVPGSGEVAELMARMRKLTEGQDDDDLALTQQVLLERYEHLEQQTASDMGEPGAAGGAATTARDGTRAAARAAAAKFMTEPHFHYQDFASRNQTQPHDNIPTFRVQDYSWEVDGFSLLNRLYPDMGNVLDDKFKVIYDLTYYTMGAQTDVDTQTFRRAIWNYIQCVYGIRHDDYDYGEVNALLERRIKTFIKTVSCYPERVTPADYHAFMKDFKHSEKVHVILLIIEARMQAELLYALRSIMHHMTPS